MLPFAFAADYMVRFVDAMTSAELVMIDMVQTVADLVRGFYDVANLRFKQAGMDFAHAGRDARSIGSDLTGGGAAILGLGGLAALFPNPAEASFGPSVLGADQVNHDTRVPLRSTTTVFQIRTSTHAVADLR